MKSLLAFVTFFNIIAITWPLQIHASTLEVNLGYSIYRGVNNASTGLNIWKGIRYAAPPVGKLRWQAPKLPEPTDHIIDADEFGPSCPQVMFSIPGRSRGVSSGNEDCLFLNIYSPETASGDNLLPVFISIHGGGYGLGNGRTDMTAFMNSNDNSFISVVIQYRLGAFGFLSSAEVKDRGVLNAGILDQKFVFEWVQEHISKFGGDPDRVTIAGESAGGGSGLLHAIAEDGGLGTKLFRNIIAASPYVPTQPHFDDELPTLHYQQFSEAAGCGGEAEGTEVFECLVETDSRKLQEAMSRVSSPEYTFYGNWAFIPVIDGTYITGPPSILLEQLKGKANGKRVLVGNNADEGPLVVPTIKTQNELVEWLKGNFVNLSNQNVSGVLAANPSIEQPVDPDDMRFATDGFGPATAVNVSQVATGQQQRAYNIAAESAVVCFSYWLATAFTGADKTAWHYQYSVPFAIHASDLDAYYGPPAENQGLDLVTAFRRIYGNFITKNDPSISNEVANGKSAEYPDKEHPASQWPPWTEENQIQLNLNQTSGTPYTTRSSNGVQITQFRNPGLRNKFSLVDAYKWEGGRGKRCDFWKELSPHLPQ